MALVVSWQVLLVAVMFSLIGGFILGAIFFVDSGGVTTTDDWRDQMSDQRKRRDEPR